MWFFVVLGEQGLENQSLVFLGGRGIGNPYIKGRERVASGNGGHHGDKGAGGFIYGISTLISVPGSF